MNRATQPSKAATRDAELIAAAEQGLCDLAVSGGADVVFVLDARASVSPFFEVVEQRALAAGFVVGTTAVGVEHGFESLDFVVRSFVKSLRSGSQTDARGLVSLLDAFVGRSPKKAFERLEQALEGAGAVGPLARLALSYVAAASEPRRELRALRAFLDGAEPERIEDVGALTLRTAKRTLADLSRLVRCMGHEGLVLSARHAERLTELSPVRREVAYTVLRELIDNADSAGALVATRIYVSGSEALFEGARSIQSDAPLTTRVLLDRREPPKGAAQEADIVAHAPFVDLGTAAPPARPKPRDPVLPGLRRAKALRAVIRACQGLPPIDMLDELTVGYESIDETLESLFEHAKNDGSVFSLLVGAYGTGKTHLLMHVLGRALADRRPVLRLSVERLDADLGNPQRHLRRLLEHAVLPLHGSPSPLDRLDAWSRTDAGLRRLRRVLEEIADEEGEGAVAARRALRAIDDDDVATLIAHLSATDIEQKPAQPNYRQDAYGRLLLWLGLLERIDGTSGPVLLIDEAENLYRGGTSKSERRTALRSLAFYCGGTLPRACVVLAVTPETLAALREESGALLDEVAEQRTLLACEDATMLRRRLLRGKPIEVVRLRSEQLVELGARVRSLHEAARGGVVDPGYDGLIARLAKERPTPRELIRRAVTRLEAAWWSGSS